MDINESEVRKKMADLNNEKKSVDTEKKENKGETKLPDESMREKIKAMANASAKPTTPPPAPAPATAGVKESAEFSTTGSPADTKDEEQKESKFVTAESEGVLNFVVHTETPGNRMPSVEGEVASEPFITYSKMNSKGDKELKYGRFRKNVKGEEKLVEYSLKTAIDPTLKGEIAAKKQAADNKLDVAIATTRNAATAALREFISEKGYMVAPVTDHDNKPTLKLSVTQQKDEQGNPTNNYKSGAKIAESGCGPISMFLIYVPAKAWDLFTNNATEDMEVVKEIIAEENPEMKLLPIKREEFMVELGFRTFKGLKIMNTLTDPATRKAAFADDREFVERIMMQPKTINLQKTDAKTLEMREKLQKKVNKAKEKYGSAEKALFPTHFRLVDTGRSSVISPVNYIPKKTQVMYPVCSEFRPKEGESAEAMTKLYFTDFFNAKRAESFPMSAYLGTIMTSNHPEAKDSHKFNLNFTANDEAVTDNPVFFKTGETVKVEPYFKTVVREGDKWVARKESTRLATSIVKKEKTKNGSLQSVSNFIGTEGYDPTCYNNVKSRFTEFTKDTNFLSITELAKLLQKSKSSSGKKQESDTAIYRSSADLAAVMIEHENIYYDFLNANNEQKELSKTAGKVQMWSNKYSDAYKSSLERTKASLIQNVL